MKFIILTDWCTEKQTAIAVHHIQVIERIGSEGYERTQVILKDGIDRQVIESPITILSMLSGQCLDEHAEQTTIFDQIDSVVDKAVDDVFDSLEPITRERNV